VHCFKLLKQCGVPLDRHHNGGRLGVGICQRNIACATLLIPERTVLGLARARARGRVGATAEAVRVVVDACDRALQAGMLVRGVA
jgi:hypothetical protein